MPEAVDHPNPSELSAFSLGQLSLQQAEKIEEHISSCQTCCDTLLSLSSEDTFVGQLQEARHLAPAIPDSLDGTRGHHSLNEEAIPGPLASHPRYEIETLIGRGGMGQVYKAKHRMMDRAVALKVINREWVRRQEVIERFRREVKTAASLTHPNIVTAYDAEQAGDLHFLVMEYVDGKDLAQIVSERGPLPVAEACEYICKAAEGLQYAHERGMVHRDIKPHNLMVTRGNVVKILDFGLASLVPGSTPDEPLSEDADGNLTYAGAIMGTPDYISPEQAQDARNVDGRSDIYSLGMTLYYLLAGQVPFGEGSAMEKLKKHAEAEPASLESIRNDIPPALLAILSKMIAKDPNERFQSPAEVAAALESFAITVGHSPALQVASGEFSIGADDGGNNVDRNTASADKNWDPRVWWVWFGCLVAGIALAFFVLSLGFMETIIFIFVALILEKISEWMTRRKQTVHSLSSGDARLLQVSELLGVISLIPLAMLAYEWLNWTDASSFPAEQRMWMYGLTAFGLSTFGGVAYGTFKVKLLYPDVPVKPVLAFTFMTIITSCGFAFLYSKPHQSISFVAGGAGIDGNGWYVTSGNTYLKHDEPGVQFGMYEDPNGGRGFTYVILTSHAGSELAKVSSVSGADLIFDGETASMKDGLSIDGKGIELDLDLNVDRSRITSSALSVNGEKIDPSRGNLFLVDLTSDQVQWNQVKVEYPADLPAPKEVVSDTQLVSDLARQLTEHLARENKKVREFLAGEMPNTDLARQNGVHPSNRIGVAADPNFPTLQIMKVEGKSTDLGKDVQKIWKLQGR
ncbi:MAG: protein kinase, partial [Planctomycetaceae bacterium]|nr:protein kinase [Planctomycetaceae bacterium]